MVDCDPDTWCMVPEQVEKAVTAKTKAIMPVHIYGHPVDMDPISDIAERYNLIVIEDAAEVHGAEYKGRKCGGMGDLSCFSFFANKIITTGEGGMILTDNDEWAEKLRSYRIFVFSKNNVFCMMKSATIIVSQTFKRPSAWPRLNRESNLWSESVKWLKSTKKGYQAFHLQLPIEKPWAKNVIGCMGLSLMKLADLMQKVLRRNLQSTTYKQGHSSLGFMNNLSIKRCSCLKGLSFRLQKKLQGMEFISQSGQAITDEQIAAVIEGLRKTLT